MSRQPGVTPTPKPRQPEPFTFFEGPLRRWAAFMIGLLIASSPVTYQYLMANWADLNAPVLASTLQSDGKLLLGGKFGQHLLRKNQDGTDDAAFKKSWASGGLNGDVTAISIQPKDRKILVGGGFTRFNDSLAGFIVRLQPDGTLDYDFSRLNGVGFDNAVRQISVQPDGKILVAGSFRSFNGIKTPGICRLNADGSLDEAFPKAYSPARVLLSDKVWIFPAGDL